ncbi:MAG: VWA domain-containing protein [Saccharospirillaceae bacterium]|nr:VWA domain-containing protein [Pseudomonadales bacterium]NRB78255.1 VWA domain-containing protein [Saccharospirillaceae bacterium]
MFNTLLSVEFNWWWMVFALPIMPIWYLFNNKQLNTQSNNQSINLPFASSIKNDSIQSQSNINWLDFLIKSLIWLCIVIALMRPQLPLESIETPSTGRDLFMVIDISGSMREQDMILNRRTVRRIDAVKFIASDFLRHREGDRVGLVFFGPKVATQAPLTYDVQTVADFIENVEHGDLDTSRSGTVIGDAIAITISKLRDADIQNKVMILLTDGEDTGSTRNPIDMAKIAKKSGIKIYTIGISAYKRGIDEQTLKQIASITDGQYFRARNTFELQQIYKAIEKLEPNELLNQPIQPKKDIFYLALSIALLLISSPYLLQLIRKFTIKIKDQT